MTTIIRASLETMRQLTEVFIAAFSDGRLANMPEKDKACLLIHLEENNPRVTLLRVTLLTDKGDDVRSISFENLKLFEEEEDHSAISCQYSCPKHKK